MQGYKMLKLDKHLAENEKLLAFFRPSRKAYIHQYIFFTAGFIGFLILFSFLRQRTAFR